MAKFGTNARGAILWQNLELMQVGPSGGQIWKWPHLVLKFGTNASGAIWWPNLELMLPCGPWPLLLASKTSLVRKWRPGSNLKSTPQSWLNVPIFYYLIINTKPKLKRHRIKIWTPIPSSRHFPRTKQQILRIVQFSEKKENNCKPIDSDSRT